MLGGLWRPRQRVYNTCAGYGYVRSTDIKPVSNWNRDAGAAGPYEDLDGFMTRADAVAESLLPRRLHVVMADLCWTGRLTGGREVADLADTFHHPVAPHDRIGPVGFMAGIHASLSQPNTLIQGSVRAFYTGRSTELVTVLPVTENGFVPPLEGPGLGTEPLPAVFERPDLTVRRSEP